MDIKPESLKHALRRHRAKRKKVWVRKRLRHYFMFQDDFSPRRVGLYARTPKVCSCYMCGNPRRYLGLSTLQERRADIDPVEPYWPLPKTAQSRFG